MAEAHTRPHRGSTVQMTLDALKDYTETFALRAKLVYRWKPVRSRVFAFFGTIDIVTIAHVVFASYQKPVCQSRISRMLCAAIFGKVEETE